MLVLLLLTIASSCKKDDNVGGTAVEKLAGDWHVKVNGGTTYYSLYTFNTADNSNSEMWIQSAGLKAGTTAIGVKGKVGVNVSEQTFSATNVTNIASTSATIPTFSIANGKVITNGTVGPVSKTPADSISFDLIVNGVTYKVEGYHKTGFLEDLP